MNCLWRMLRLKCLWVELRTFSRSFNLVSSAIFSLRIQGWGVGGFWIGVGVQHKNLINQNHCDWENFGIKNSLNERCYKVSWSTFQHWHLFLIQILVWRCLDKLDLDEMMRPQSGHLVLRISFDSFKILEVYGGLMVCCHKTHRVSWRFGLGVGLVERFNHLKDVLHFLLPSLNSRASITT